MKHKSKQLHLMKDSLTKLQVFCTIAEKWGKANCQPCGSQVQWHHSKEVETVILKLVTDDI